MSNPDQSVRFLPAAARASSRKLIAVFLLISTLFTVLGNVPAQAENPPRKILTGWIPYYSIKTSLPAAINNADLIKEVAANKQASTKIGKSELIKKEFLSNLFDAATEIDSSSQLW
jgi:hypothetical protein